MIEIVLLSYFAYVALYNLTLSVAGLFYQKPPLAKVTRKNKFAVLIPAYKEDGVIFHVAKEALNQTYPKDRYEVVVIADSLQPETISKLKTLPINTCEVSFEKSTKVKAMNEAMKRIGDDYDFVVILDADNIMEPDFLETMNNLHEQGFLAIQGRRAAKNENNSLSYLDGLSEEINNHVYGRGGTALHLSAALKGSGMSFRYAILKDMLKQMASIGGFDRELELRLVNEGIKVKYASNAIIYDEKVEKSHVFENQRKRWISSQYFYLKQYFLSGIVNLFKGRITYFNSTVLRNVQLPRLINLGLITGVTFTLFFLQSVITIPFNIWFMTWSATILGILLAIPKSYYGPRLIKSVFRLPAIFWKMFLLLFKLKGANKKFIHTPHSSPSQK
ncbi:glycosyltransferase family 2 protein [Fulvivirga sp. 29W222]|uniref:Glycosyltransferase family 2 protein n=1 Tax=Fulvivirga marina TaxID=2494733 RepID=A0A937KD88_9BACT|nr:glycosyltransferase family 2 protein [Fulvivirga marina]